MQVSDVVRQVFDGVRDDDEPHVGQVSGRDLEDAFRKRFAFLVNLKFFNLQLKVNLATKFTQFRFYLSLFKI